MSQINETDIKTPGVYTTEIPTFPPSVAQVATAVPAFIGYTKKAQKILPGDLKNVPTKITSLLEYEQYFGGAAPMNVGSVAFNEFNFVSSSEIKSNFYLYDSLRMFYLNGGSKCYIVSVGTYDDDVKKDPFIDGGLAALKKYDEPTLILFPDAIKLEDGLYDVQKQALKQCSDLQDRFCILDALESPDWEEGCSDFRDGIGVNNLNYGAVYTPYLKSSLSISLKYSDFIDTSVSPPVSKITKFGSKVDLKSLVTDTDAINAITNWDNLILDKAVLESNVDSLISGDRESMKEEWLFKTNEFLAQPVGTNEVKFQELFDYLYKIIKSIDTFDDQFKGDFESKGLKTIVGSLITNSLVTTASKLISYDKGAQDAFTDGYDKYSAVDLKSTKWGTIFDSTHGAVPLPDKSIYGTDANEGNQRLAGLNSLNNVFDQLNSAMSEIVSSEESYESIYEESLQESHSIYKSMIDSLEDSLVILPPSGTIAGIYAAVDGSRGVWKAPANVSLNSVTGLTQVIDDPGQKDLNVDVNAGKSINAIRAFTGRGILVWGARTLDGNSNEWRYVSVRRFFIMVEESAKKATLAFVFEPNDANTWVKIRSMLENYLTILWRQGALAGAKPEQAFYVKVGLGQTMTALDILEGRLIVEIGMAAVRPAEFIILRFMHKMQES